MFKNEIWKPVYGYESLYECSSLGRVKSLPRNTTSGKILKQRINNSGYYIVTLCKEGKRKCFTAHSLVWKSFNGVIPTGFEINHKDENSLNNALENLEILTHRENVNYGSHREKQIISQPNKKEIRCTDIQNGMQKDFISLGEAQRWLGIKKAKSNISKCLNGKVKSAYGYIWEYL